VKFALRATAIAAMAVLAGCASPPAATDVPPAPPLPIAWNSPVPWGDARPAADAEKGEWWRVFRDPQLDALLARAQQDSPALAVLGARLKQAQAATRFAEGGLLPRLDASLRSTRQKTSANRPPGSYGARVDSTVQNETLLGASVAYEVDLFGRISGEIDASRAGERQLAADVANARLLLTVELTQSYFALRQADAELTVIAESLGLQTRALDLLSDRRSGGASSGFDVIRQQALVDRTRTQQALLQRQRQLFVHTLATLSGQPAGSLALAPEPLWHPLPPTVPLALPSEVLQRRPDIASAQEAVAAANAQIGVARAAFYPSFVIGGSAGFDSRRLADLFDGSSLVWSIGASVLQSVFDGGRNRARLEAARAAHEGVSASYRQTVLRALQEVEDGLASLQALADASSSAAAATGSATKALDIALARYGGGLVSYLDVVTAQQDLLDDRRRAVQIQGQQLAATAYLVKALGGGWSIEKL
jgi:NodT family efflux transporter outer membrane factor (OMF) lipoprotein